ncbi:hypothetical protein D3C80_1929400 [compost metagenome]
MQQGMWEGALVDAQAADCALHIGHCQIDNGVEEFLAEACPEICPVDDGGQAGLDDAIERAFQNTAERQAAIAETTQQALAEQSFGVDFECAEVDASGQPGRKT